MYAAFRKMSGDSGDAGDFELLYSGKVNNVIPVYKYRSKASGMRVVFAQVGGPVVNGYFCLATEAFDDDGLPHTLEHLVFMGSEKYPYKGVLDLLANRCLASGTNAWTDTDHTCYTMTTAGSEGFLNLMPIFLDHVLYPTITDAGYITEVHHINGEGEDAGVVYCEMQARENTGESLTHLAMLRAMYPPSCGYRAETGGILKNLRESTSHKKVKDYHAEFYRPENLYLIITGMVKPEEVFEALRSFEEKMASKEKLPPYKRPWMSPVPPLESSVVQTVPFPSDDEDNGMVLVGWRGPLAKDQYTLPAVMMLGEYLTDTAVAPLQRDFVEIEEAYCNNVRFSIIENSETLIYIKFANVPKAKLSEVQDKLFEVLGRLASGAEEIDMSRMHSVIHRRILEAMSTLEDSPHDSIAFYVIGEFLYGHNNEDMDLRLNQIAQFRKLDKESQDYWVKLIKNYFVDQKYVTIIGDPSKTLMEGMGSSEKERVKTQQKALGPDGLKKKGDVLEKATENNEVEPPEEMLTCVPIPSVNSISFHPITPASNQNSSAANKIEKFPLADIPITFQLDDIQTNFVTLWALFDTTGVPAELKPYQSLYMETITESPILRNGVLVGHEDVITELAADTVYNGAGLGVGGSRFNCGNYAQIATLQLKLEIEKYEKGVQWMRELLYHIQFTAERVKIIANKMLNSVASMKRNGRFVTQTLAKALNFNKESNHHVSNIQRQHRFLTGLLKEMETQEGTDKVLAELEKLRSLVTRPCKLRIHMAAHIDSLAAQYTSPHKIWVKNFLPADALTEGDKPYVRQGHEYLYSLTEGPGTGALVGVGSVESSFLIQTTECVKDFNHPDIPAIMVYMQFLTQLEGPMWKQIRGLGLSYHYSMYMKAETGLLYFILFKSTHIASAYEKAKEIVDGYLSGSTPFNEVELESAKSSLIFEIIEEEKTPAEASHASLLSYFRGVPADYNKNIIVKVPTVTNDDLKRVGAQYFAPLFDVKRSKVAICCHPTKVQEVQKDFKGMGRDLKVIESMEDSFLTED